MQRRQRLRSLVLAACAIASLALDVGHGAERGVYVGGSIGTAETLRERGPPLFDDDDSAWKVTAGWRPLDWFAIEGSRFDLGSVTVDGGVGLGWPPLQLEQTGCGVFSVFLVDIAAFDLFAKIGAVRSSADGSTVTLGGPLRVEDTDTDIAWGVGGQWRFGEIVARADYERFETSNGGILKQPRLMSVGVLWTF